MLSEKEIFKTVYEKDLVEFAKFSISILEPEVTYMHNWHVDVISKHLTAVVYGDLTNLDINVPPRTIKSLLVNVILPCWVWTRLPWFRIISCSHSSDLSIGFNILRRRLIESPQYQYYWPIKFLIDLDTKKKFGNTDGGFMYATSVGGSVTGEGGHLLITDDVLNAQDAHSETKREFANNWYSSTFYNRLQDKKSPKRINIAQRLHENDLSGHIAKKYKFETLVIPMQKEEGQVETSLGWVDPRSLGEFIHPERYGQEEKDDEYKGLGEYGWAGQMQQAPVPAGGGIIKKAWIRVEETSHLQINSKLISVDATFKDAKTSDYVVMQAWGRSGSNLVCFDMIRGKWSFQKTMKFLIEFEKKHNTKKILIEDKANGPALISVLKEELMGIKPINPKDSKEARVHAVANLFECGNVIIDKNIKDIDDFIKELTFFPNATHDDIVDTCSQALLELKARKSYSYSVGDPLQSYR